jgi:hypothetical protein
MYIKKPNPSTILDGALAKYRDGVDPTLIELPEQAVFPYLIPVQPITARKARVSGMLLGKPAPLFVRRGRFIRYRLSDVFAWLAEDDAVGSTAEAGLGRGGNQ